MAYEYQGGGDIVEQQQYTKELSERLFEINTIYSQHCRKIHEFLPPNQKIELANNLILVLSTVKRGSKLFLGVDVEGEPYDFSQEELTKRRKHLLQGYVEDQAVIDSENIKQVMEMLCKKLFVHSTEVHEALVHVRLRGLPDAPGYNTLDTTIKELQALIIREIDEVEPVKKRILALVSKRLYAQMPNQLSLEEKMDVLLYKMTHNLIFNLVRMFYASVSIIDKASYKKLAIDNRTIFQKVCPKVANLFLSQKPIFDVEIDNEEDANTPAMTDMDGFIQYVRNSLQGVGQRVERMMEEEKENGSKKKAKRVPVWNALGTTERGYRIDVETRKTIIDDIMSYRTINPDHDIVFRIPIYPYAYPDLGGRIAEWARKVVIQDFEFYVLNETDVSFSKVDGKRPMKLAVDLVITRSKLKRHIRDYLTEHYLRNVGRSYAYENIHEDHGTDTQPARVIKDVSENDRTHATIERMLTEAYHTLFFENQGMFEKEEPPNKPIVIPWKGYLPWQKVFEAVRTELGYKVVNGIWKKEG